MAGDVEENSANHRALKEDDEFKLLEGRRRFSFNNDVDSLDLAENLFRMNREVLDKQNAEKLVELYDRRQRRIFNSVSNEEVAEKEEEENTVVRYHPEFDHRRQRKRISESVNKELELTEEDAARRRHELDNRHKRRRRRNSESGNKKESELAEEETQSIDASRLRPELDNRQRRRRNSVSVNKESELAEKEEEEEVPQPIIDAAERRAAIFNELPPFGYRVDGIKLPRLPPLGERFTCIIDGCSLPFQKQLTHTDISRGHNRLAFNKNDVRTGIFPLLYSLNYCVKDLEDGISVKAYDSRGREYNMNFKTWTNNKVYVLNTPGWCEFVEKGQLIENIDWVSVWVFNKKNSRELCFALIVDRFPTPHTIKKRRGKTKEPLNPDN
ncbi:hypothetical protein M9H77_14832 [Catharanthus roseus]|uniref:Uncharacterized protein n=1 Tax=Catharanthus roseus TaxID=4058 RepID=A0ACC0BPA8_CATRO|nr:hypothetical protein M9H77_14832 [Catharanthus roseus]